ncbi:MAG: glutamate decarboxylase, partial [Desulfobacteraceae bacterium]
MSQDNKPVITNLDYLRKLFIMPDSPDKFIEFGHELLEMIHDFFKEKGGIHSAISLPELSQIFNQTEIPQDPRLIKDVLTEIKEKITAHSVKVGSPYYIGHMTSAVPYFMILLEMIIAALNQNQVKIETAKASSFVERELVTWFHRLFYNKTEKFYQRHMQNPRVALGNVTANGTLGNLTALLVARERAFPARAGFPGVRLAGLHQGLRHYGYDRGVILVSARGHYSLKKSASILGIGEENLIAIPVDDRNRMDIGALNRRIKMLTRERVKIIAIVGIAGTTETGNIDNLAELAEISEEEDTFFHVDACWGGSALLVDEYRPLFRGIEQADSVTIDAHKLLYCPLALGMVLFQNEKDLHHILHSSNYIIRRNSVDMGRFTLEGSRPFACLKAWASLKIIGRQGYNLLFQCARENTQTFMKLLEAGGHFELLNDPELFIVNYRFIPRPVQEKLLALKKLKSASIDREQIRIVEHKIRKINHIVNALNIKLHKEIRRDDTTFVSRTKLESTVYRPQNIVVLRAVLINPLANRAILEEIVHTQNRIGLELWPEFREAVNKGFKDS